MLPEAMLELSFYRELSAVNDHVTLVQNINTNKIYVKKQLSIYDEQLYFRLQKMSLPGIPHIQLIIPDGSVFLIDFDAAKTYDSSKNCDTVLMGTADYAAPEQFGFRQSDARTDIYGLGVLLNVMLTGHLPKEAFHDGILTKVIIKCTAMDPSDRFISMNQLSGVLESLQRRVGAPEYGLPRKPVRYHKPRGWKTWLPPGFRTMTPWKIILACIIYPSLLWIGLSQSVDVETTAHVLFNRICATVSLLIPIFFLGNYRGIADRFPISNSYIPVVRLLGVLLWSVLIIFALLIICVLLNLI